MRDEPDLPSRQRRKSSTAAAGLHRSRHRDPPIPGQTILSARFPPESGRPIRRTLRLQRSRREICRACRRVSAGRQIDGKHYRLWAVGNRPSFEHRRFSLTASRLWASGVGPLADRRAARQPIPKLSLRHAEHYLRCANMDQSPHKQKHCATVPCVCLSTTTDAFVQQPRPPGGCTGTGPLIRDLRLFCNERV